MIEIKVVLIEIQRSDLIELAPEIEVFAGCMSVSTNFVSRTTVVSERHPQWWIAESLTLAAVPPNHYLLRSEAVLSTFSSSLMK